MNFEVNFMQIAQKKTSEARLRANKKYSNSKWRPAVYLDMKKRKNIEDHFISKGFKTFNEYVCALIEKDMMDK